MTAETKPCPGCDAAVVRRDKERPSSWNRRRYCSRGCAGKHLAFHPAKLAGIQARYERPGERARHAERRRAASIATWADPVKRASMTQAAADRIDRTLNAPAARAKAALPETRAKAAASYSRTARAWCRPDLWDDYQALRNRYGYKAAEARAIIEAQMVADDSRAVAKVKADMVARRDRERREAY